MTCLEASRQNIVTLLFSVICRTFSDMLNVDALTGKGHVESFSPASSLSAVDFDFDISGPSLTDRYAYCSCFVTMIRGSPHSCSPRPSSLFLSGASSGPLPVACCLGGGGLLFTTSPLTIKLTLITRDGC